VNLTTWVLTRLHEVLAVVSVTVSTFRTLSVLEFFLREGFALNNFMAKPFTLRIVEDTVAVNPHSFRHI
jgi:hypothetical protein